VGSGFLRGLLVVGFAAIAPVVARANAGHALPLNQYQAGTETTTLIPNGDFENGTTGFSVGGDATVGAPFNAPNPASTVGSLAFQANNGSFSTLSPVILTPGTQYILSGYLWDSAGFTGVQIQDNVGTLSTTPIELFEGDGNPYFVYSDPINGSDFPNGLKITASGSQLLTPFHSSQIDNIAVTPLAQFAPVTPEPAILGTTLIGGLLLLRRSRRSRAVGE
jgi:hypothetical protein